MIETCKWTFDIDTFSDTIQPWHTECKQAYCFNEGGPEDNKLNYCPYCGKEIEVVK